MKRASLGLLTAAGLLLSVQVAAAPACPSKGLKTQPTTLVTASGRHRYSLEIAASPEEQSCGMMYRKSMKPMTGMVFPFSQPRPATFWMENTDLPLDLIFVAPDNRVLSIASGKPYSRDLIDSNGVTAAVIELRAGEAKRIGLKPGDRVER